MNVGDIIFTSSLFFSILFGYYYRTIRDKNVKKNVGTAVGIFLLLILTKTRIVHLFVMTFINAIIITFGRKCHLESFTFSFMYLMFFRKKLNFGDLEQSHLGNLAQMILTLKLVGLAFEVNTTRNKTRSGQSEEEKDADEAKAVQPAFLDIFHYAFSYIGVITGPYYSYRTFMDHLNYPFVEYADWKRALLNTLKYVPLYAAIFFWVTNNWPISYAASEEFYERSWLYRYWYIWPTFLWFRMRIYIGFLLSSAVCIAAGLGAYPSFTQPKPGQGPSQNFTELKKLLSQPNLSDTQFDFSTVKNLNAFESDFCTTYRDGIKNWNICVQYWLAVYIYKRFPSKKFRTYATMMVSAVWHGVYLGAYVCLGSVALVLALEDIYYKLYLKDGNGKVLYQWIHWFFKMHFFSYQVMSLELMSVNLTLQYYNSVYHMGLVVGVLLYIAGWRLLKIKESNKKIAAKEE